MDPDAQVSRPRSAWRSPGRLAACAGLAAVIALGLALRVARFHSGDYYEDGASHWWTAAYAFDRGVILDPFGLNTSGWWLPGYDPLMASLMAISGSTDADLMRWAGVGAWAAATLCLYALARPAGAPVALFACALFALSPFDVLNSTVTTGVEPAVALLLLGLLLLRTSQNGKPALLGGASAAFSVAVLFRYEAIVFVGVILVYQWWWASTPTRSLHAARARPYLLIPLAVAAAFVLLTWGENFVSQLVSGPTVDYSYAEAQGLVSSSPFTRGLSFWLVWGPIVAAAGALMLIGVAMHLGRLESWLVVTFAVLLTIFLTSGSVVGRQ